MEAQRDVATERQRQFQNQLARGKFGLDIQAEQRMRRLMELKSIEARMKYVKDNIRTVRDQASWDRLRKGLVKYWPEVEQEWPKKYNAKDIGHLKDALHPPKEWRPEKEARVEITHPKKKRKTKVRESEVAAWEKKGWVRGVPLPEKGQTNKDLIMIYKRAIDQNLKKYEIESGLIIKPDGTIDINAYLSGKLSVYQTLQKKAAAGNIRATEDLAKIDYWYKQIDNLTGVPQEITGRSEEEKRLNAIDPFRVK